MFISIVEQEDHIFQIINKLKDIMLYNCTLKTSMFNINTIQRRDRTIYTNICKHRPIYMI